MGNGNATPLKRTLQKYRQEKSLGEQNPEEFLATEENCDLGQGPHHSGWAFLPTALLAVGQVSVSLCVVVKPLFRGEIKSYFSG